MEAHEENREAGAGVPNPRKQQWLTKFAAFAVESLADGVHLIDRDARIVYVNKAACEQSGYSEEELLGMRIFDINPGLTKEIWDSVWGVTVNDKIQTIETEHRNKDGRLMPVEILANYVEIDGKQYSCSFTRDITRRREMEARMRQSEKMEAIGQLAGGVAHDFNNQLGGILGYADLLRIECADRPQLARYAEAIIATAKRSSSLNAQLLAFARQGKYLAIPVDLNKLVDEIALMLERSLNKNIMTVKILTNERAFTTGDPAQLQNALLNLAINARDAMPGGGKLIISTAVATLNEGYCSQSALSVKSGRYVKIRVADTGIGMSEDVRKRIFEPFFTTKEKGKGTGMGLASVYGTVKKHKGAIDVESRPGRGTEMTVYLPLTENAIEVETIGTSESRKPSPGARVLLIEDEEVVRKAVEQMLTMLGCRVTAVTNGNDAIALYKDSFRGYDVVFLDLIMPGMDGKETYRRLRAINPGIIAITVSGYSVDGDVEEMLKDGVKDFLQKPFGSTELSETLARVLKTTDG